MNLQSDDAAILRSALSEAERARDVAVGELAALKAMHRNDLTEAQHRLRNTISVVRAIVHRTADEADEITEYSGLLDARLTAYMNVQAAVAIDPASGIDLELLILDELLKFGIANGNRFALDGPAVDLSSRAAGLVALILHDLVSRLILDGFDWSDARLDASWADTAESDRAVVIHWVVTGGAGDADGARPSAWTESLRAALSHQLSGTIAVSHADGATLTEIRLPYASCVAGGDLAPPPVKTPPEA